MNIVVLMKQTFDTEARIDLDSSGKIIQSGIKQVMNPYDEYAVEEAVRIKEAQGGEVTVVCLGPDTAVDALRQALAMGCDKAVLLNDPALLEGDGYSSALALAAAVKQVEFDLVLAGWVAVDDGSAQTAVRVAEILDIPQVTIVSKLLLNGSAALVEREIEGGMMKVEVPLPSLITVQKGINEPRYPSMKGIMQAKKKEIKKVGCKEIGLNADETGTAGAKVTVIKTFLPPKRQACRLVSGETAADAAKQLAAIMHNEDKVI